LEVEKIEFFALTGKALLKWPNCAIGLVGGAKP